MNKHIMNRAFVSSLPFVLATTATLLSINHRAEDYISTMMSKEIPHHVKVLEYDFIITSVHVYPPGKLTAFFAEFLIENNVLKDKIVADIGCGCCALGIIAAKEGAAHVMGTDVNSH